MGNWGMTNGEWGTPGAGRHRSFRDPSPFRIPHSAFPRQRTGLTLVELLITMVILAILAAAILGTASAAFESSRRSRTQSTIAKINGLVMERWASYESRRADLSSVSQEFRAANLPFGGQQQADLRLLALRELMKYEMPDRWSDVTEPVQIIGRRPGLAQAYQRRYDQALSNPNNTPAGVLKFENAECLYVTVMNATGDGEARTLFSAQDIGDIDNDGLPEFVDGWGNPIEWIRWPAGYYQRSALMTGDADADHDPFDPFRRNSATPLYPSQSSIGSYPSRLQPYIQALRDGSGPVAPGFRIVPFVYSAGPDAKEDIDNSAESTTASPSGNIRLSPYAYESDDTYQFGTPEDNANNPDGTDNSKDNLTNHAITY